MQWRREKSYMYFESLKIMWFQQRAIWLFFWNRWTKRSDRKPDINILYQVCVFLCDQKLWFVEACRMIGRYIFDFFSTTAKQLRNECLFFSVHGIWIAVRNKQIAWTAKRFSCDLFVPHCDSYPMNREKKTLIPYIYNASNKDPF